MSDMPQTETEWREELTPEQYQVLRQGSTERAFSGEYWDTKKSGTYRCAGCGEKLFSSETEIQPPARGGLVSSSHCLPIWWPRKTTVHSG